MSAVVAIAGCPNSGKTSLFNQLTGAKQKVGNWPGQTVERHTGEFVVDGSGNIVLPLIGQVKAAGLTSAELESELVGRYRPDYLVNPRISVQIKMFRPYYIMGEVQSQGSFDFTAGMTYLEAIARAGGYTYRAKKDVVYVVRADGQADEVRFDVNEKVQPGNGISPKTTTFIRLYPPSRRTASGR